VLHPEGEPLDHSASESRTLQLSVPKTRLLAIVSRSFTSLGIGHFGDSAATQENSRHGPQCPGGSITRKCILHRVAIEFSLVRASAGTRVDVAVSPGNCGQSRPTGIHSFLAASQ